MNEGYDTGGNAIDRVALTVQKHEPVARSLVCAGEEVRLSGGLEVHRSEESLYVGHIDLLAVGVPSYLINHSAAGIGA